MTKGRVVFEVGVFRALFLFAAAFIAGAIAGGLGLQKLVVHRNDDT